MINDIICLYEITVIFQFIAWLVKISVSRLIGDEFRNWLIFIGLFCCKEFFGTDNFFYFYFLIYVIKCLINFFLRIICYVIFEPFGWKILVWVTELTMVIEICLKQYGENITKWVWNCMEILLNADVDLSVSSARNHILAFFTK